KELSCNNKERDNSGATTEKDGFSDVAATNKTVRLSTAASKASCWVLENLWTSSLKSTVSTPRRDSWRVCVMTARTCFTPESSADRPTMSCPIAEAINDSLVVLPVPGGQYKITEASPEPSTNRRKGFPGASKWSCPNTSSNCCGRMRAASGEPLWDANIDPPRPVMPDADSPSEPIEELVGNSESWAMSTY